MCGEGCARGEGRVLKGFSPKLVARRWREQHQHPAARSPARDRQQQAGQTPGVQWGPCPGAAPREPSLARCCGTGSAGRAADTGRRRDPRSCRQRGGVLGRAPCNGKSDGAMKRSKIIIGSSQLGLPAWCFLFKAS